jgi:DNA invertase Pin-like site-specific DNA recombinase
MSLVPITNESLAEISLKEVRVPKVVLYARVSTEGKGQTTDNQTMSLAAMGYKFDAVYEENVSGGIDSMEREGFSKMFSVLESGDTVVFPTVSRIGRKTINILQTIETFKKRGIKVEIAQFKGVDLTSPVGAMFLAFGAVFAEHERATMIDNTKSGLRRTKAQGTMLGPPLAIPHEALVEMCAMRKAESSVAQIQKKFKMKYSINAINTNVKKWADNLEGYETEFIARAEQYKKNKHKIAARQALKQ